MNSPRRAPLILSALLSMALYCLAFHPVDLPIFGWFCLVPFMVVHANRGGRGAGWGMALGWYLHFAYVLTWIAEITWIGTVIVPFLGLPFVLLAVKLSDGFVHRSRLSLLLAWGLPFVGTEVLRDQTLGLTWSSLGYSQWRWLEGIQSASVFRVHLLSLALWAANAALAQLVLAFGPWKGLRRVTPREALFSSGAAAGLLLGLHLWGAAVLETTPMEEGPLAVGIQPNISQKKKMGTGYAEIWEKHERLLAAAGPLDPDLMVFAETIAMPVGLPYTPPDIESLLRTRLRPETNRRFGDLLPRGRGQVSVLGYLRMRPVEAGSGVVDEDDDGLQEWNVAGALVDGRELLGEYEKRQLVPYGERILYPHGWPGRDSLKDLIRNTGGYVPDLTPGEGSVVLPFRTGDFDLHFGLNICFEIVFPEYFRDPVRKGADFLVNISNDAWYGTSAELDLVHVATRFRAIEERRGIIRVSNSGISTVVDPCGRYLDTVEVDGVKKEVAGVVSARIPICREQSLYARYGEVIPLGFSVLLFLLFGALVRKKPKAGVSSEETGSPPRTPGA